MSICIICKKEFKARYAGRDKVCSEPCRRARISESKIKYTQEQIDKVCELRLTNMPRNQISEITGVPLSKIKTILFEKRIIADPAIWQKNIYEAKIRKDPKAMHKLMVSRMGISVEEYNSRISSLKSAVAAGRGTISGLAPEFGLNSSSVVVNIKKTNPELLLVDVSTPQLEIMDFVKSMAECMYDTRKIIPPFELDIYVPSLKLGIEFCGVYWHSDKHKNNSYHYDKYKLCEKNGIRLITIFEDEWIERRDQIKGVLKSCLQKNDKVYARKMELSEIPKEDVKDFLDKSHIQGSVTHMVAYGLLDHGELVGVITGSRHHRQGHESDLVLSRLAFKNGVSVVGGSSRLLKALVKFGKDSGFSRIVSWSDNRFSQGRVYEALGFKMEKEYRQDYSYVKQQKRFPKQSMKKEDLIKMGGIGSTEREMAKSLKFLRIYDCGKKRWVLPLS